MEGLTVEVVARDGKYLFLRFRSFFAFEIIQNNVLLRINSGGNVETVTIIFS
jgi:hypothetical protein